MQFALGLPTEQPEHYEELSSGEAMVELARAAEDAGMDAIAVTDHPFPEDRWLRTGGHHAFDPLVALAYVASATSTIKLLTNILVVGYRNPFLAAKGVASLDSLSGGRLILGVAPGYLEPEFNVLGANFEERNDILDESLAAMRAAWTGESVSFHGQFFTAEGHTMQPVPAQQPGPPVWIGGNSTRAMRRAVELAQAVDAFRGRLPTWWAIGALGSVLLLWPLANSLYPVPPWPGNVWPYVVAGWLAFRRAAGLVPAIRGAASSSGL